MSEIDFTIDRLATQPLPHLAAVFRQRREAILQRWEPAVCLLLPDADALTRDQLRDSLPDIMDQMANALDSGQPPSTLALVEMTKPHGAIRFHQQFSIRELIAEYRIWRRIVFEEVCRGFDSPLSEVEITALNMAIDTTSGGGVMAYVEHQREQIQRSTEVESKYLSFLSHDLRNQLNHAMLVLQLHTQELQEKGGFEQSVADLNSVQRSMFQTMEGMERMLQAERLRKGTVKPRRETVDLKELVASVAGRFVQEAQNKGLKLETDVPPGSMIESDPDLITLVLQNLIGNAVKYSRKGTVRTEAVPQPVSDGGQGWVLSVADQGPGVPPEQMDHLFIAFTRGLTHGQPGVGLGLTIAAQAAKALGGELKADSKPGVGTAFRLILPDRGE